MSNMWQNRMKSKSFGNKEIGKLLAELRTRAGFSSAAAAAAAFGWSASTLAAHEGGRRRISPLDAEVYADVFHVKMHALQNPKLAVLTLDELKKEAVHRRPLTRGGASIDVGHRLVLARRLRGFRKRSRACATFGFARPNLTAHELGVNAIADVQGSIYAKAYGISLDWLMNGSLPSGLGVHVDERLREDPNPLEEEVDRLAELVNEYAAPDRADLDALRAFIPEGSGTSIREVVPDFGSPAGFSDDGRAPRLWSLPDNFDRNWLGARAEDIVVLPYGREGGRFFVDVSDHDIRKNGDFLYVDARSELEIARQPRLVGDWNGTSEKRLIGRVLAEIMLNPRR